MQGCLIYKVFIFKLGPNRKSPESYIFLSPIGVYPFFLCIEKRR